MPKTKARKEPKTAKERETKLITDFKRKSTVELKKLEVDLEMYINTFINALQIQLLQFPPEIQNMTFAQILNLMDSSDDEDTSRDSSSFKSRLRLTRSRITISDDGYATDKTRSYKSKVLRGKIDEKHTSILSVKYSAKKRKTHNATNIYAHTPVNRKPSKVEPITPKVCPNTPVNILRRPRNGETVISMGGSPLMVSTVVQEDRMANLCVPLNNGDVLSLLPTGNLRESMLPVISPRTREQLKTLKNHIEKFIS